jgi:hypothetical protein
MKMSQTEHFSKLQKVKNALKELIAEYGFVGDEKNKEKIEENCFFILHSDISTQNRIRELINAHTNDLEVAELIAFLRKCRGNKITLSGSISNPQNGELKGAKKNFTLDIVTLAYMEMWANTFLENQQIYQRCKYYQVFGWEPKKRIKNSGGLEYYNYELNEFGTYYTTEEDDDFYTEAYSDEELSMIIEYERNSINELTDNHTSMAVVGGRLDDLYNEFNDCSIFKSRKNKDETGKAIGIQEEYAFLHDYLATIGEAEKLETKREKYEKVRDYITTYRKHEEKNIDMNDEN